MTLGQAVKALERFEEAAATYRQGVAVASRRLFDERDRLRLDRLQ